MDFKEFDINLNGYSALDSIIGENIEETEYLNELKDNAIAFLNGKKWCSKIENGYFCFGIGKVIGIFLFKIIPNGNDVDNIIWVIVGDLPSAYLSPLYCKTVKESLEGYIIEMQKWIDAVKQNATVDDLFPVNVKPTHKYAIMLEKRINFLKDEILPTI